MNIMIVDDEAGLRQGIKKSLGLEGYTVFEASNIGEAKRIILNEQINIILLDLNLGEESGHTFLNELRIQEPGISVIIITGYGTINSAVSCMKSGAVNYLTKPIDQDMLLATLKRTSETITLQAENAGLKQSLDDFILREKVFPSNARLPTHVDTIIKKVMDSNVNILISGETGTGKEVTAKRIHFSGIYQDRPFISLNCSVLNDNLIESELFGHEKGAFTGAISRKQGRFEITGNGTLFLDEIGDMSPAMQVKLLRVIEEKTFERVGGTQKIKTNCRIIAATNKDLKNEILLQKFRDDLYYRLNIVEIYLPPLRERTAEISNLTNQFIEDANREYGKDIKAISGSLMDRLLLYSWPGNIRQLKNVVTNAVLLSEGSVIKDLNIPDFNNHSGKEIGRSGTSDLKTLIDSQTEDLEKKLITGVLMEEKRNITNSAMRLGISRKTLYKKIEFYKL
jgi:DNA-binding NtrC family response regulator